MLTTKMETSHICPTTATSASAKTIATIASRIGTSPATTAPKTSRSTTKAAVGLAHHVDHVRDPLLGVGAHPDRDRDGVAVRRDQGGILVVVVAADAERPPGGLQRRREPL